MSWWTRLWGKADESSPPAPLDQIHAVHLEIGEWKEEQPEGDMRQWLNSYRDLLTLAIFGNLDHPPLSQEAAWQRWSRQVAEGRKAGLIEVRPYSGKNGAAMGLIYKNLNKPAYVFTGVLIFPKGNISQLWTVMAGEKGMTGVREALVSGELFESGSYTIQDYQNSFAQDPYEPNYHGVDRSVLHFVSDDERYDERFPHHPLTRVRQTLAALPDRVAVLPQIV
ncbi:MAG TPA: hypothetical protein VH724_00750 [Candidatus Angelobacter sp.]|jgi:hypothetical protein|nr:hypothetical protein [Candidatus Angelobacter sp.]